MRLLVTGGAGYIGSIVAQQLLARGDDVTVLDSLYRGHRAAVPEGAAFVEADLLDPEALPGALAGIDAVVHFAALSLVAESVEYPERYWRGNVVGALNLLDAMRAAGVGRLVFSSTAATYGEPPVDLITEDTPNLPVNAYGNSKLTIDRMLADEARAHGLAAVSLRYFNVAGASGDAGRGPHARDAPDPAGAAGGGGQAPVGRDLRHRLPDAGRHGGARLRARRGSRDRARAGAGEGRAGAPRHLQPRVRAGLLGARGDRRRAGGDRARDRGRARSRAGRAIRRSWWPPTRRLAPGWAGRPSGRWRTWCATPGPGTRRTPTATESSRAAPAATRRACR